MWPWDCATFKFSELSIPGDTMRELAVGINWVRKREKESKIERLRVWKQILNQQFSFWAEAQLVQRGESVVESDGMNRCWS